jgi:hypothetical protein
MYKDIFDESIFASIYRQACGYEYEEDAGYSYDSECGREDAN